MASIPLAINTQQPPSLLSSLGQVLQTKDLASQISLRTAQTQQAQAQQQYLQAEAAQRQKELQDVNTFQQALGDPDHPEYAQEWGSKGTTSFLNGKVSPAYQQTLQQNHQKLVEQMASTDAAKLKTFQESNGQLAQTLQGLRDLGQQAIDKANGDPAAGVAAINSALPGVRDSISQLPGVKIENIPNSISSMGDIDKIGNNLNLHSALTDAAIARSQAKAAAAKTSAEAQGAQQKADLQKQFIEQAQKNPQAIGQQVDSIVDPRVDAPTNQAYKTAILGAMQRGDMQSVADLFKAASAHAASLNEKLSPAVANMEVQTTARKAAAEVPAHVSQAVQTQLALAKNSPDAFAGIADPVTRRQAEESFAKNTFDAVNAVGDSRRLQDYVAAAASGNKAAGGLLPVIELRGIVNRVNRQELTAAGNPGDIIDKGIAALNGVINGVPASPEGLKAIKDLADVQQQSALNKYNAQVATTKQVYGAKVQPLDIQGMYHPALPKGNGQPIDKATASRYLDSAGGDVAKARKAILADGWKL